MVRKRMWLYLAAFLLIPAAALWAALGMAAPSSQVQRVEVTIDNTIQYQTIEGFGATARTLVSGDGGDTLTPAQRAQAVDALFNQVRLNLGQVPTVIEAPATSDLLSNFGNQANDNNDPFNLDWNGFYVGLGNNFKQKVVDLAGSTFDLYPDVKIQIWNTRTWTARWLDDIRSSDYNSYLDECAEQVLAGIIYWQTTYGSEPRYAMLFNEPTSGNRELGTPIRLPQEIVDIVKRAGARLRSAGFNTVKFVVPAESRESKSLSVAQVIMNDPVARQYVGAIAYHPYPYGSTYSYVPNILATSGSGHPDSGKVQLRNQLRDLGEQYGIPVWMTEVSNGYFSGDGVDPTTSMDLLRGRAIHIHDEFLYANAAAFFGMNQMWDTTSQALHFDTDGSELLIDSPDNIVLIDIPADRVCITGTGRAIGHYARWINRGAVRIEATSTDALLQVTAFRDDSQERMVLVIINNASTERVVDVSMNGLELRENLIGEQSTEAAFWHPLIPFVPTTSTSLSVTVPAESVTTIAGRISNLVHGNINLQGPNDHSGARVTFSGQPPAFTSADGSFQIQVPPGTYSVTVEKDGFLTATRISVVVDHGMTLPVVKLLGGDFNGDGVIDINDLAILAKNYGRSESPWP